MQRKLNIQTNNYRVYACVIMSTITPPPTFASSYLFLPRFIWRPAADVTYYLMVWNTPVVGGRAGLDEDGDDEDGDDEDEDDRRRGVSGGRRDRGRGNPNGVVDEWSDSESMDDEDSEDDAESSEDEEEEDGDGDNANANDDADHDDEGGNVSPESTARPPGGAVRPSSAPPPYRAPGSSPSGSSSPETEVAVVEPVARRSSASDVVARGEGAVGKGVLSVLRSPAAVVASAQTAVAVAGHGEPRGVTLTEPIKVGFENGGSGGAGWGAGGAGKEADGGGYGEGRMLKKAATLPTMPRVSLLAPSNRPKGGRKCVQFQVGWGGLE